MATRPKATRTTSISDIGQLTFNERSQGQRNVSVGGAYDILGALDGGVHVGKFASLMIANTDTAAHYVKFGDDSVTAPSGIADGVYLPPESLTYLGSGLNAHVISDSSAVAGYKLQEFVTPFEDANARDPGE